MSAHPNFEAAATTVQGAVTAADASEPGRYAVAFTALEPGTRYLCRVGDGKNWSEWNAFRTADAKPAPFRFLYVGDAQNNIKSLWSRTIRAADAAAPDARFIASAGDLVAEGHDVRLWNEWRDAQGFVTATIPSLPVVGNHDLHRVPGSPDAKAVLSVSPIWHQLFSLPDNGVDAAAFDPETRLIFASSGDGTLAVFHERSADEYEDAGAVKTQQSAKTLALDPATKRVFRPAAEFDIVPPAEPGGRLKRTMKPGSFVVLVVGK